MGRALELLSEWTIRNKNYVQFRSKTEDQISEIKFLIGHKDV